MKIWLIAYANDTSAYVPQEWANESLLILEENMIAANLVHRDFINEIANYGETVNTRRPGTFEAKRKTNSDNVTDQDATATNVAVTLNQHLHVTFVIKDGEQSKSFKDLVMEYLQPAMLAHAQRLDQIVLGQYSSFLDNGYGHLGTAPDEDTLVDLRRVMNTNKAYEMGRNLILNPVNEADLLKRDIFVQAQMVGDDGGALREAMLGRKYGFNTYHCQNMASVTGSMDVLVDGEVDNAAGYPAGTTTMTIDGLAVALPVNSWFTVEGDRTPQRIVSSVGGATPTSVTFSPGLKYAVVDNADLAFYTPGAVNLVAGYASGWAKPIIYDTFTLEPQVGQLVTFGVTAGSAIYTIVAVDTTANTILLDRPLEAAAANDAAINLGPPGNYNFAFHKNAIALVTRPLALPPSDVGAKSAVVNYNGLALRVVITYDGTAQGLRVTIDHLCGVKVLDTDLGAVMFG